jgi:hypothetical protein
VKKPGLLAAAALLVIAVWEVAVLVRARAAAPAAADWQAIRAAVDAGFREGDLVVFAPAWMDPVGRQHLGQHLTVDDVARMDDARYGRVWEISARGAAAPEARGRVLRDERHGALRLRLHERPAERVVWSLRSRAGLHEVDFAGRHCAIVRPPGKLEVADATLGTKLVVRAGLADFRARKANRGHARVKVLVDDAPVAEASVGSESGWVALPPAATAPGAARVSFVTEVDRDRGGAPLDLQVCIAAEARQ